MGHWDDTRIAIEKRFNDNWTSTPKRFWSSGVPFVVPTTPYVAITIEEFDADQVSLGTGVQSHRYHGMITFQVFVPERTGAKVSDGYCDTLGDLFRRAQFSQGGSGVITCHTPQKRFVGTVEGWFQQNLIIPFQRDIIH